MYVPLYFHDKLAGLGEAMIGAVINGIGRIFQLIVEGFQALIKSLVYMLNWLILNTPYPGRSEGRPNMFGAPAENNWQSFYDIYQDTAQPYGYILLFIAMLGVLFMGIFETLSFNKLDTAESKRRILAAFILITLWWPLAVLLLSFTDALTQTLAEAGGSKEGGLMGTVELLGDVSPDGSTIMFYLVMFYIYLGQLTLIFLLTAVWLIRYFVVFVLTGIMPIFIALWAFQFPGFDKLSDLSKSVMEKYLMLVFVSIPGGLIIGMTNQLMETLLDDPESSDPGLADDTGLEENPNTAISDPNVDPSTTGDSGTTTIIQPGNDNVVGSIEASQTSAQAAADMPDVFGGIVFIMVVVIAVALPFLAGTAPFVLIYGYDKAMSKAAKVGMGAATGGAGLLAGAAGSGILGAAGQALDQKTGGALSGIADGVASTVGDARDAAGSKIKGGASRYGLDRKANAFRSFMSNRADNRMVSALRSGASRGYGALNSGLSTGYGAGARHLRGRGIFGTPTGYGAVPESRFDEEHGGDMLADDPEEFLEDIEKKREAAQKAGNMEAAQRLGQYAQKIRNDEVPDSELVEMLVADREYLKQKGDDGGGGGGGGDGGGGSSAADDELKKLIKNMVDKKGAQDIATEAEYLQHLQKEKDMRITDDPWDHREQPAQMPLMGKLKKFDKYLKGETTRYDKNKVRGQMLGNWMKDKFGVEVDGEPQEVDLGENDRRIAGALPEGDIEVSVDDVEVAGELEANFSDNDAENFAKHLTRQLDRHQRRARNRKLEQGVLGGGGGGGGGGDASQRVVAAQTTSRTDSGGSYAQSQNREQIKKSHPDQGGSPEVFNEVKSRTEQGEDISDSDLRDIVQDHDEDPDDYGL